MQLLKTRRIRAERVQSRADTGYFLLETGAAQTVGLRQEQQDEYLFRDLSEKNSFLAAVADGMGGLACGHEAARLVLDEVAAEVESGLKTEMEAKQISGLLAGAAEKAGKTLYRWCKKQQVMAGSTLAVVLIYHNEFYFCSIGDSRIYLCRDGEVFQINEDHLLENYLFRCSMRQEEVQQLKGSLYSYLGQATIAEIDFSRRGFCLQPDDMLVLCTDGFYQAISENELAVASQERHTQKQTEGLMKLILKKKIAHQDNATVVMLHCQER